MKIERREIIAAGGLAAFAAGFSQTLGRMVANFTGPEEKKIAEGRHITTLALSEPGTGSHFHFPEATLVREGDGYRLNGTKSFVTNGGPGANPQFFCDYHTIITGTDPVAVDRIGYDIVLAKRIAEGLQKEGTQQALEFMLQAEKLSLGVADRTKIDLKEVVLG